MPKQSQQQKKSSNRKKSISLVVGHNKRKRITKSSPRKYPNLKRISLKEEPTNLKVLLQAIPEKNQMNGRQKVQSNLALFAFFFTGLLILLQICLSFPFQDLLMGTYVKGSVTNLKEDHYCLKPNADKV